MFSNIFLFGLLMIFFSWTRGTSYKVVEWSDDGPVFVEGVKFIEDYNDQMSFVSLVEGVSFAGKSFLQNVLFFDGSPVFDVGETMGRSTTVGIDSYLSTSYSSPILAFDRAGFLLHKDGNVRSIIQEAFLSSTVFPLTDIFIYVYTGNGFDPSFINRTEIMSNFVNYQNSKKPDCIIINNLVRRDFDYTLDEHAELIKGNLRNKLLNIMGACDSVSFFMVPDVGLTVPQGVINSISGGKPPNCINKGASNSTVLLGCEFQRSLWDIRFKVADIISQRRDAKSVILESVSVLTGMVRSQVKKVNIDDVFIEALLNVAKESIEEEMLYITQPWYEDSFIMPRAHSPQFELLFTSAAKDLREHVKKEFDPLSHKHNGLFNYIDTVVDRERNKWIKNGTIPLGVSAHLEFGINHETFDNAGTRIFEIEIVEKNPYVIKNSTFGPATVENVQGSSWLSYDASVFSSYSQVYISLREYIHKYQSSRDYHGNVGVNIKKFQMNGDGKSSHTTSEVKTHFSSTKEYVAFVEEVYSLGTLSVDPSAWRQTKSFKDDKKKLLIPNEFEESDLAPFEGFFEKYGDSYIVSLPLGTTRMSFASHTNKTLVESTHEIMKSSSSLSGGVSVAGVSAKGGGSKSSSSDKFDKTTEESEIKVTHVSQTGQSVLVPLKHHAKYESICNLMDTPQRKKVCQLARIALHYPTIKYPRLCNEIMGGNETQFDTVLYSTNDATKPFNATCIGNETTIQVVGKGKSYSNAVGFIRRHVNGGCNSHNLVNMVLVYLGSPNEDGIYPITSYVFSSNSGEKSARITGCGQRPGSHSKSYVEVEFKNNPDLEFVPVGKCKVVRGVCGDNKEKKCWGGSSMICESRKNGRSMYASIDRVGDGGKRSTMVHYCDYNDSFGVSFKRIACVDETCY